MATEEVIKDHLYRLDSTTALESAGINPYPAEPPKITHLSAQLQAEFDALRGAEVGIAGRMVSKRVHGRITFTHIEDQAGRIQAVIAQNRIPTYGLVRDHFNVGDFIGVTGSLDRTKTGEISVWAEAITMLTKALRAPTGRIGSAEVQQRQRYLHTLTDEEARGRFRIRSKMIQMMRDYFTNRLGCLEVETPVLDSTYGGASARPFTTHHNALDTDFFLRISNELYLKRMTVGGFYEGVFEFSRNFRNEGMDKSHNPEFTLLELYKPFWDYHMMMDMAEDLMTGIVQGIHGRLQLPFGNHLIDFSRPWRRLSIYDGLRQKLGIEPTDIADDVLTSIGHDYGVVGNTRGEVMVKLFDGLWQDELINPTFVLDYPAETSSLTKRHRNYPNLTERFELYVAGMETMNCYSELNDPRDQRDRFELEVKKRKLGDQEAMQFDEDFITAQEYGMPLQAGIGIGIDRWAMLLTNTDHIRQVIYFPMLRPRRDRE